MKKIIYFILILISVSFASDYKYITENKVNLRRDASLRFIALGKVKFGAKVEVLREVNDWSEIKILKEDMLYLDELTSKKYIKGWLLSKYLSDKIKLIELPENVKLRLKTAYKKLKNSDWRIRYKGLEYIYRNINLLKNSDEQKNIFENTILFLSDNVVYNRKIAYKILNNFGNRKLNALKKYFNYSNWRVRFYIYKIFLEHKKDNMDVILKGLTDIQPQINDLIERYVDSKKNWSDSDLISIKNNFDTVIKKISIYSENHSKLKKMLKLIYRLKIPMDNYKETISDLLAIDDKELKLLVLNLVSNSNIKIFINLIRVSALDENFDVRNKSLELLNRHKNETE